MENIQCTSSTGGTHQYNPWKYSRDDSGFWLECVHCGQSHFFDVDTESELFELFGMNEYDED